jgi:anaerobic selenocysteine-containing dehydrogenase
VGWGQRLRRFAVAGALPRRAAADQDPRRAAPAGAARPVGARAAVATRDEADTGTTAREAIHPRVRAAGGGLAGSPPFARWDEWSELDARSWPRRRLRRYALIPTVCFNCESACGLLAFVDQETGEVRKFEGQPLHPASRGRNCAKGPATINQVRNPERILYPLRRVGARGEDRWERVSWDAALEDIAGRIRAAIQAGRRDSVVYHVGRPGEDLFTERVVAAWGVDGHNSHTNVCSAGARTGYHYWFGFDRPMPDYANARFVLLLSSHLESGHYFNPQAQRIGEARLEGTKVAVIDTRLSNSASQADWWLCPWPGTEAGLLLALAHILLQRDWIDREFLRRWVNWEDLLTDTAYLDDLVARGLIDAVPAGRDFADFLDLLRRLYAPYTPAWAEAECGVAATALEEIATEIHRAGHAFASTVWRSAAAGHLGGWMVARALLFLNVLVGAIGEPGSVLPAGWCKFVPRPPSEPEPVRAWNELHFPRTFPLANLEMSFLLPHLMREQNRSLDVYFTRVYNPVWTNPDGFSWIEMLRDPERIGLHVALTPVWSETALFADYVLPMGLGPERHDLHSYETHAAQWIGFRQPVQRVFREAQGEKFARGYEANPGEVWEENEFWVELSWRIDPDGSLGIRRHFADPDDPGRRVSVDAYYGWIFAHAVPGLPEAAAAEGVTPLQYMRRHGSFCVTEDVYRQHERPLPAEVLAEAEAHDGAVWVRHAPERVNLRPQPGPFRDASGRVRVGILQDGLAVEGFPTPSGRIEFFSRTLREWGWPEYAIPIYPRDAAQRAAMPHLVSQVHPSRLHPEEGEFALLPTFRLPTLIHTRTNGAKWLYEIAQINPVWIHPADAARLGVETGDLVEVETEIGRFVDRAWVTEAIHPGVIACSHHLGRWRLHDDHGTDRWNSSLVRLEQDGPRWRLRVLHGVQPFPSPDPDSSRIWWSDGGVHQNLIFPVQPDPVSGQHCWHQRVRVRRAPEPSRYGEIEVDTAKAHAVYRRWLELCRPVTGSGRLRRPIYMLRPLKPHPDAFRLP